MDPRHLFMDERLTGMCVYCGAKPETRDHVPSKVLLDKPYPEDLPVVGACKECNENFSLDEQYVACFLECVRCGTVEPSGLQRPKIKRILTENPKLKDRIGACQRKDDAGNLLWYPEIDRLRKIVLKLARGHLAYGIYPEFKDPVEVAFAPLSNLSDEERVAFEDVPFRKVDVVPEIGSRGFLHVFVVESSGEKSVAYVDHWIVVQPGQYRYVVIVKGGILVKLVLGEYLACTVSWE